MVNTTAINRPSNIDPILSAKVTDIVLISVDEVVVSRALTANGKKKVEHQSDLVYIAEKSTNNALNGVASYCGRVVVTDRREVDL